VDSSTLSAISHQVLGDKAIAVTVLSPTTPSREVNSAEKIAEEIGIKHKFIKANELLDMNFVKNPPDRCYYCKEQILSTLVKFAEDNHYKYVFEGTNADEIRSHRPGYNAIKLFEKVKTPWADLGFTKNEIRSLAKKMGFSFHNKPSLACLASRIPFGKQIDEERLRKIDLSENAVIRITGVSQIRIRDFDDIAVIEVSREDRQRFFDEKIMDEVVSELKKLGFKYILLDLEGYYTGKLSSFSIRA
jgi:uncharacterized protein